MKREGDGEIYSNWRACNSPQGLVEGTGRVGNRKTNRDHPNYSIVKIDQNTEKSPGNLRGLAVTQTSVNDDQLTHKRDDNNNNSYYDNDNNC